MKAAFGIVSLLVALAIVAVLVSQQLRAVKPVAEPSSTAPYPDHGPATTESPKQLPQKMRDDVSKSMQDAAAARSDLIEK
jgi:hypothetical protein